MTADRRLILVRHAETYSNRHGRDAHRHVPDGVSPMSLTDRGRLQAEALARALAGTAFAAVLRSSAPRCGDTLAPFLAAGHFPHEAVCITEDLLEIDNDIVVLVHHLTGAPASALPAPDKLAPGFVGTRGHPESGADVLARVRCVLDPIVAAPPGDVLIVAHHGTNNAILAVLSGTTPWDYRAQENACINVVRLRDSAPHGLEVVNSLGHLPEELRGAYSA